MHNLVTMNKISKSFPGVKALQEVDFSLEAGEVMALLGENGAGKSTLMKVLSGVYTADSGEIIIDGEKIDSLSPSVAQAKGISIIHQELNLCNDLTIEQNIFLGREMNSAGFLRRQNMRQRTQQILQKLGIDLSPATLVGDLSVSLQQMVEIAKALIFDAKVLIMDEPTSALSNEETLRLFKIIKDLRAEGYGIVYISHRLAELESIVDRVTIMRDGQLICTGNYKDFTIEQIISNMVGREITEQFPHRECEVGEMIFEVEDLCMDDKLQHLNFHVKKGEVVALAGLMGAGRTETTRAIFGADKMSSGTVKVDGMPVHIHNPLSAIKHGIVLVPEDRRHDGLCTRLSVRNNLLLPNLDQVRSKLRLLSPSKQRRLVTEAIDSLRIKVPHPEVEARNLSGGNQQKVVVGKWLRQHAKVVIFDEPTRGIDVGAKVEIYNIMNQLKESGVGILFVSSELPEVLGMADRIYVMCEGRITGELTRAEATQEKILHLATLYMDKTQRGTDEKDR